MNLLLKKLKEEYPEAQSGLYFTNPLETLIAVLLSAQCRDERVNKVTKTLFAKYPDVEAYAKAEQEDLEKDLLSLGLYRNKAKNIRLLAKEIVQRFSKEVPSSLDGLMSLPGVGRKTALCVLQEAYGKVLGVAVDTHVARLSQRLGLTENSDRIKIEKDLKKRIPKKEWALANHLFIAHGRKICDSRRPRCSDCVLSVHCLYQKKKAGEKKIAK